MDECAAAAIPEDGGENNTRNGETASENDVGPSIEDDTVDSKYPGFSPDCNMNDRNAINAPLVCSRP